MSRGHERFLELAAASIDFDLAARERAELSEHLATCPSCSRSVEALRADARTIRELPVRALALERMPFVLDRALRRPTDLRPLRLVLVAIALGLLMVGVAVVGSELLRKNLETVVPTPVSTASPSSAPRPTGAVTWTPAGALSTPDWRHTAVVMGDGRVLVVGGDGGGGLIQIYDPASGSWSTTVDSAVADRFTSRWQAVGISLADGGALVVGGAGATDTGRWTDVFPQGGSWEPGPTLLDLHVEGAAVQLLDGRILVVGGAYDNNRSLDSAEIVSLDTGDVTPTGSLVEGREGAEATVLQDGRVLVTGGRINADSTTATAEIYDPATGRWTQGASMRDPRYRHTATLLPDGRVLVVGGGQANMTSAAELYDPASDTWATPPEMPDWRAGHGAALLADGRVLVVGGFQSYERVPLATTEVFDPLTGTWSDGPTLLRARTDVVMVTLLDGSILVIGGGARDGPIADVELLGLRDGRL